MADLDLDVSDGRTVHLVSSEGESFDVAMNVAKLSNVVKNMIEEDTGDDESQEIPLPNVKTEILAKVIEYIQHYKNVEKMEEIEKVKVYLCIFNHIYVY